MAKWFKVLFLCVFIPVLIAGDDKEPAQDDDHAAEVEPELLEYAKGSLCGYCDYCKFCKLCDADCPCEPGPGKPNCHMCKYCKYCYMCSSLCDTICQPGGFIDKATAAIVNALPTDSVNREQLDKELNGVKDWVDKQREEL